MINCLLYGYKIWLDTFPDGMPIDINAKILDIFNNIVIGSQNLMIT